jgi:hypothetical protein
LQATVLSKTGSFSKTGIKRKGGFAFSSGEFKGTAGGIVAYSSNLVAYSIERIYALYALTWCQILWLRRLENDESSSPLFSPLVPSVC